MPKKKKGVVSGYDHSLLLLLYIFPFPYLFLMWIKWSSSGASINAEAEDQMTVELNLSGLQGYFDKFWLS